MGYILFMSSRVAVTWEARYTGNNTRLCGWSLPVATATQAETFGERRALVRAPQPKARLNTGGMMKRMDVKDTRNRGRHRRLAILWAALAMTVAVPASAAAYWDYSGTLSPSAAYGEGQGVVGWWYIRLSRSNCNAKIRLNHYIDGWQLSEAPNGCADSDYSWQYDTNYYTGSQAINLGGSNVFVNVRIDGSL